MHRFMRVCLSVEWEGGTKFLLKPYNVLGVLSSKTCSSLCDISKSVCEELIEVSDVVTICWAYLQFSSNHNA